MQPLQRPRQRDGDAQRDDRIERLAAEQIGEEDAIHVLHDEREIVAASLERVRLRDPLHVELTQNGVLVVELGDLGETE